jgi:hypothetical protein
MWVILIAPNREKPGRVIPCVNEDAAKHTVWRLREELGIALHATELPEWLVDMLPRSALPQPRVD